ncbi:unnamed protein product [Parnassius apollo]|uniref:(apollo) hypothetical protein n=1 Tax=Parnassius apollo TaxID=110799 RepID=A0A8S3WX01_PARAO|nr:unnamed protein product [Parnassius apollo]
MAFKGFSSMKKNELDKCLNNIGAQLTAVTTKEIQIFSGKCTSEYTTDLIDILSQIITNLEYSECEIQLAKKDIFKELTDYENSAKLVVFDYLHQAAYQGTPLAQRVIGSIKNIEKFDGYEACCFINKQYKPENMVLAISGGTKHVEIFSHAQKRFSHICSDEINCSNHEICRYTGSSIVYRDDSMPFAHVAIALEVPGYGNPDYWSLFVANCILGSWDRSQGGGDSHGAYLSRAAASNYLCESYEPFYIAYRDTGLWGVYYVAQSTNLDDLLHNVQQQWMHFCASITDSEVERGVNFAKLKLAKEVENVMNSSYDIGLQILYTNKRLSLLDKYKNLSYVTAKIIKEVGHKYIYDRCPVVSAIGPTECLPDYNRIRSDMYWLRY